MTALYESCNELATREILTLRVVTTDTAGPARSDRLEPAARSNDLYAGYEVQFCRKLLGAAVAPGSLVKIWQWVRWADLVHVHGLYSFTTMPGLLACRLLGRPVVISPHGALLEWSGTRLLQAKHAWNRLCAWLVQPAAAALHVCSSLEEDASRRAMPGIRTHVVPYGVTVPPEARRAWLPGGRLRILFMGRLDPIKGLENLLSATAQLPGRNWQLRICGHGEPHYVNSLRNLCKTLRIDDRVVFSGFVDGDLKRSAYVDADLCVVPSFSESFSMVVLEALAHGTPVIASRGTPWSELQTRGAGLWEPNDPDSLRAAIMRAQKADLGAMGKAGREWVLDSYSWPRIADRLVNLYCTLAA